MMSADIKVNSRISRLWPDFEWYNNNSSMLNSMKYLVEAYKRAHNIKVNIFFLSIILNACFVVLDRDTGTS